MRIWAGGCGPDAVDSLTPLVNNHRADTTVSQGANHVELITNAGLVVKLVLMILAYFSVTSWAIIIYKSLVIHRAIRESARFLDFFWARRRFDAVSQGLGEFRNTPLAVLFREAYQELLQNRRASEGPAAETLDVDLGEQERVARVLRRATTSETQRLEKYLAFLATTGSAAFSTA